MAVTNITISQDNKNGNVNLFSVHNPLVFMVDVDYTASAPETLYVELQDEDSAVLNTFAAIPYEDSESGNTRTFVFLASDILRSYMDDYEDFEGVLGTLEFVENITKQFTLRFYIDAIEDSVTFVACHAARQYGDDPAMVDIYDNDDDTYYGAENMPVYVYFYNESELNTITVDTPTADEYAALDYDDEILTDFDDLYFKTL